MRTFLITGASSGVGLALTYALSEKNQRVVMAVSDASRGEKARDEVLRQHPGASLQLELVDLTDQHSVRALAAKDLGVEVLINNAGIAFEPKRLTTDGVLSQFAANHLGHFALTALMFERLSKQNDARVVVVTSTVAKKGRMDLENLDGSRGYGSMRAYTQSKLANLLFGAELDRRLRARGSTVKSVLAHPGIPATAMQQKAKGPIGVAVRIAARWIAQPASHGAAALLEAATNPAAQGGEMWGPDKRVESPPAREVPWRTMGDLNGAARLWERSEALAKVRFL